MRANRIRNRRGPRSDCNAAVPAQRVEQQQQQIYHEFAQKIREVPRRLFEIEKFFWSSACGHQRVWATFVSADSGVVVSSGDTADQVRAARIESAKAAAPPD